MTGHLIQLMARNPACNNFTFKTYQEIILIKDLDLKWMLSKHLIYYLMGETDDLVLVALKFSLM